MRIILWEWKKEERSEQATSSHHLVTRTEGEKNFPHYIKKKRNIREEFIMLWMLIERKKKEIKCFNFLPNIKIYLCFAQKKKKILLFLLCSFKHLILCTSIYVKLGKVDILGQSRDIFVYTFSCLLSKWKIPSRSLTHSLVELMIGVTLLIEFE